MKVDLYRESQSFILKNHKVIVINGYSRGGTNLLWNVLQSHPNVVSPILETTEILIRRRFRAQSWLTRKLLASAPARMGPAGSLVSNWLDHRLYTLKMRNVASTDNGQKSEGVRYTEQEVSAAALCLKSTDKDIILSPLFQSTWEDSYFVGLMRNGYAICESWMRRGRDPYYVGRFYRWFGERMIADSVRYPKYAIVKFEDLIRDPFRIAEELYEFAGLEPRMLSKLRFKSKRVLDDKGNHEVRFGDENAKYWFDRETISEIIDPSASDYQTAQLSASDRAAFEAKAMPIMKHFGYA